MTLSPLSLFTVMGFLLMPAAVSAKEWYAKPEFRMGTTYDDNLLLAIPKENGVFGYQATLLGTAGVRSALSNLALMTQVDFYQYWGQSNLDRNNWTVGLDTDHSISERHKLALKANYTNDSALFSELLASGVFSTRNNRQLGRSSYTLSPSWSYFLSDTKIIKASYSHNNVAYEQSIQSFLQNYVTHSIALDYSQQWNPKTRFNVGFNYLNYQIADIAFEINNYALTATVEHQFSDSWDASAFVGVRKTDTSQSVLAETQYGPLFGVGLNKRFQRGSFGLNYNRSTNPSGIGLLLITDNLVINSTYDLTERLKLLLYGSLLFASNTSSATLFERTYYALEPSLSYALTKRFTVNAGYRYQNQAFSTGVSQATDANSVFVSMDYRFDEMRKN